MQVARLRCAGCGTEVHGEFVPVLANLGPAQQLFAERFLHARGNLRELERELGVSYQTLRGQLDEVVTALEQQAGPDRPADVLSRLRRGELRPEDALRLLESLPVDEEPDLEPKV